MDLIVAGHRYLSIVGKDIDKLGQEGRPSTMPEAYHHNRVTRDRCEGYHITFAHPGEISAYLSSKGIRKKKHHSQLRTIIADLVTTFGDPSTTWERPKDLGLGRLEEHIATPPPRVPEKIKHGEEDEQRRKDDNDNDTAKGMEQNDTTKDTEQNTNGTPTDMVQKETVRILHTSYFRVIHWPFGQKLRAHLGLPPTSFHITIGFNPKDVHHAPKGPDTILLATSLEQDPDLLTRWVASAVDYPEQTLFLKRLNQHLIKVDLGHLAEPWRHHIKEDENGNDATVG